MGISRHKGSGVHFLYIFMIAPTDDHADHAQHQKKMIPSTGTDPLLVSVDCK